MSRIGKKEINIPESVEVTIEALKVYVKGVKGELSYTLSNLLEVKKTDRILQITKKKYNTKSTSNTRAFKNNNK